MYWFVLKLFRPKQRAVLKGRMHKKRPGVLYSGTAAVYALSLQKEPESNAQGFGVCLVGFWFFGIQFSCRKTS